MTEQKYTDGISSGYVELPVPAAWLTWTRGDAKLAAIKESDPGAYFGGWRAFVKGREDEPNPSLPLPIVKRVSEDGKHPYEVYATNVLNFVPIIGRMRYELRQRVKDETTGREYEKTVTVSKKRLPGYAPNLQVFSVIGSADMKQTAYGILKINKWSAFISYEKAVRTWKKAQVPAGKLLVRHAGSIGTKDGAPNFEVFGQGRSTPIEAIDGKPFYLSITPELDALFERLVPWRDDPLWNREGEVEETPAATAKNEFLQKVKELNLSNIDIEQLLKENDGDYSKALAALAPEEIDFTE